MRSSRFVEVLCFSPGLTEPVLPFRIQDVWLDGFVLSGTLTYCEIFTLGSYNAKSGDRS
jgi:hypothetical protein